MEAWGKHFNWPKIQPGFAHIKNKSKNTIPGSSVFVFPHQNQKILKYPCKKPWKKPKSPPSTNLSTCYGCMDLENFHGFGQYYPWKSWICFKHAKIFLAKPWHHKRSFWGAIIGWSLFLCSRNPLNLVGKEEDFGLTHSLCRPPPSPEFQLSPQLFPANKSCSICKLNSLQAPKPGITPNQANRSLWGWKI